MWIDPNKWYLFTKCLDQDFWGMQACESSADALNKAHPWPAHEKLIIKGRELISTLQSRQRILERNHERNNNVSAVS